MVPGFSTDTTANIVVVPEPSSALLILTGIGCLFTLRSYRSKLRAGEDDN
jgi:hypothetical protein